MISSSNVDCLEPFHLESPKFSDFFFIPFGHILEKL